MAQRILAVLGAVVIVAVAVVVRGAIDDRGGDGGDDGADGSEEVAIICAQDLQPACDDLSGVTVTYQAAGTTADLIAAGAPELEGVDGWVTSSAWTEVVASRDPQALGDPTSLATTSAVVAVDPDRTEAVQTLCAGAALWRCLGDRSGTPWAQLGSGGSPAWGAMKTGLPDADSATGLGVLASVASGFFGRTDFASNDFELEGFGGWLDELAAPSGGGEEDPVNTLATVKGKYTAVGDVTAAVAEREVGVLAPEPATAVSAVFVPLHGGGDPPDLRTVVDRLLADGWAAASSDGPPPATLKPGVMAALYSLWTEVTR